MLKVKDAIKMAKTYGWVYDHTRGDHHIFKKAGHGLIVIPGNKNKTLSKGVESALRKEIKK